jgi:hypothetical protein
MEATMRKVERETASKFARRIARERARAILEELFDFLKKGIPADWDPVAESELREARTAFDEILKSALAAQRPDEGSLAIWNRCLNIPEKVEPYYFGKLVRTQSPVLRFRVVTPSYLKRAADLLKRFLTEFRNELPITGRNSLLAICPIPICQKLFLKVKANQVCCKRKCGNKFDYDRRTSTKAGVEKNREKSRRDYLRNQKEKRTKKADEKNAAMISTRDKRIFELYRQMGGMSKNLANYQREQAILDMLKKEKINSSGLSGYSIRAIYKDFLKK